MQFIFKHVSIYTTLGKIPWTVFFLQMDSGTIKNYVVIIVIINIWQYDVFYSGEPRRSRWDLQDTAWVVLKEPQQ